MKLNEKVVTIQGEALLPKDKNSPCFVVYSDLIKKWDKPFDHIQIDNNIRDKIIEQLKKEMEENEEMKIDID